jgi:hypothetical protein
MRTVLIWWCGIFSISVTGAWEKAKDDGPPGAQQYARNNP